MRNRSLRHPRPVFLFAVVCVSMTGHRWIYYDGIRRTRRSAIKSYLEVWDADKPAGKWKYHYRRGVRVIKVAVVPTSRHRDFFKPGIIAAVTTLHIPKSDRIRIKRAKL